MPGNNGFNDENMIIFGTGIDLSGFLEELNQLEKEVNKAQKNKKIDVGVAKQSSEEIEALKNEINTLQDAMKKLGNEKISKSTFHKYKDEFLARFKEIEDRLGGLQNALGSTIDQLGEFGVSVNLKDMIKQFSSLNDVVTETSQIISTLSDSADGISIGVRKDDIEGYENIISTLSSELVQLNKVLDEETSDSFKRLSKNNLQEMQDYLTGLKQNFLETFKIFKEQWKLYQEAPEDFDLIPYAGSQKAKVELVQIAAEINKVTETIRELSETEKNVGWESLLDDKAFKGVISDSEKVLQSVDSTKAGVSDTVTTIINLLERVKKESAPNSGEIIKESQEALETIQKTYQTSLSLNELLAKGAIHINVEFDEEKFASLKTELEGKIDKLQESLVKKTLVVPIKISVSNSSLSSQDDLSSLQKISEKTKTEASKSADDVILDIDKITKKGLSQVLRTALTSIEAFAKGVKENLQSIFKEYYEIHFKVSDTDLEEAQKQLQADSLLNKLDLSENIRKASEDAQVLADKLKDVLDLSRQAEGVQIGLTNYGKAKGKKLSEVKQIEELMGKLSEYKESAKKVIDYVQKEVFNKKKVYLSLDVTQNEIDNLQSTIEKSLNDKNFGKNLTKALERAELIAQEIYEVLKPLDGLEIKVAQSGKGKVSIDKYTDDMNSIIIALQQIVTLLNKVQEAISKTAKNSNSIQKVSTDFTEITDKLTEIITLANSMSSNIREDIKTISTSVENLGTTIDSSLDGKTFKTLSEQINQVDLSVLERNLAEVWTMLLNVTNAIDGLKASINERNLNSYESQWQSIAQTFHSVADIAGNIDLRKSKSQIEELLKEYKKYRDVGGDKPLDMLTSNTGTLAKLQSISEKINGKDFNISENLNNINTEELEKAKNILVQLETALSSITTSLQSINGLENVSKTFNALNISDAKLQQIQKIPDVLKQISQDIKELNELPTSKFVEQISKIAEQGEGLKALADILKNSQKKIQASMDVMTGNDKNKKILNEEIKLLEKYRTVYKNRSKEENEYSEVYSNNLREMEVLLTHIDKFKNLDFVSEESITEVKQLNSNLENIADNLEKITKTEVKATDSLKNSLNTQLKVSDSYERNYSRSWGFGKIEEGYVSEYSTKLSEIRQKLDEINSIRERFKNGTYLQEDLVNIITYNKDLEEMFVNLAKIEQVSKNTTTTNLQNKIGQYIQKNTRLTSQMYKELIGYYEELGQGSKLTKQRVNEIATAFNNVSLSAKTAGLEGTGFLDAIKNKLKYGWAQSIAMFFSFYDIIRYVREISSTVTELNSNLIELAKVSDTSIKELYNNFSDFKDIAEETGGTINDIIESTADWARNGYNLPESKELARLSSIFQNIGDGLTESQANEYLVSTLKGFNLEAEQAIEIMDKINNVSNNAASGVQDIGEALERSSSAFGAANTSLSESIALLTTANEVLQSPETVGTAFKSMSARLRAADTEITSLEDGFTLTTSKLRNLVQALTGYDIQESEDSYHSIYEILKGIGEEWENLTDLQQASLSEELFGKRNSQVGFAILNNIDRLEEIYALAEDSEGSAMAEQEKYLEGVQYQIDNFTASVENLANTFMSSDFLKGMIATGTSLVNILAEIIDKLGAIPVLIGAIGTAIGSKQNLFFNLAELGLDKDSDVLPLVPNSDLGALASTNSTKQLKALATEFKNLGTELSNTGLSYDEFIAKVAEGNLDFAVWLDEVGTDAPDKLKAYQKELAVSTLKTVGLKIVTAALQGVLMALASAAIAWVVDKISNMIHATERAIEAGEEAKNTIQEINDTLKTQQETVNNSAERFAELSQGIDQLTGKNISLSDEDYQEFLDISNELAEVFPSLTRHYDENENAIVDLDGDVTTITQSLNSLLEVEEKLARQKILENVDDVFEGVRASVKDLSQEVIKLEDDVNIEEFTKALDSIGAKNYGVNYVGTGRDSYADSIQFTNLEFLTRENLDKLTEEYGKQLPDFVRQLNELYNDTMSEYATLSPYISTALLDNFNYSQLTPALQVGIQEVINNLDWNSLNIDSWDDAISWIDDTLISLISNNPDLANGFELALNTETKFNNDEITWEQYKSNIQAFLDLLKALGVDENIIQNFIVALGFEIDSDNNIINTQVNNLTKQLEDSVGEESAKAIAEGLTKGELEAVQDSEIDWSEILKTGQELDKQIEIVKRKIRQISQTSFEINLDRETIVTATEGIEELQSVYQTLYDSMQDGKVGEELALQFADVEALEEKLGNVSEYQNIWDNFYDTVTDGSHSFEEMEDALNQVLTAYVNATVDLQNFDREQADAISTQLQLAGVTKESADVYVEAMTELAETSQAITDAGYDVENITREEINELVNLGIVSEETAQKLALYNLKKKLANDIVITTSGDITNLLNLAKAANVTSESLARLAQIKSSIYKLETTIDSAKERGASEAYLKNMQTILDGYVKDANELASSAQAEITDALTFDNILNATNKASSSSSGGGSSSSKEEDLWKEAYEKELAALDHLHEMELISDIQYYEEREKLNDKYFKDNEKYAEEYNENLETIYKGFQSAYKQYCDDMTDYWQKSLDAGLISFSQYCSNMKSMLNSLHDAGKIDDETYYSNLSDYYGNVVSQYDKAINAAQRVIEKRIDELEKQKEALEDSYALKKEAIQTQIDSIQEQIDATQSEIDKIEEANEARQEAINMQKALYELNRAENQRSQMVYTSENGFVYEANSQDIKDAQDEVENLRYEQQVSALEETVTVLQEQIEVLEEQMDSLDDELEELTDKIDEQIDSMQDYSDRLGEVANAWTEAQEDMVAASIWGSDWQNQILSQNDELVRNFESMYVQAQYNQAEAARTAAQVIVDSYNKQIEALNALKTAQASDSLTSGVSTSVSQNTTSTKTTSNTSTTKKTNSNTNKTSNNNSSSRRISGHTVYGSGTDNATPGYHEISENGDEIILDNYGNAYVAKGHQLHLFEGGEKVYDSNETQELLKGKYLPIDTLLPSYSQMLSKVINGNITTQNSIPSTTISTKGNVSPMKVDNSINITIGDIQVTEVDNASQIAKAITNKLPNALLQELNRK